MKNKFSKWDVGGGSRSIVQGLNLFTSRNLFKSLKSILMVVALLSLSSNVWGATVTFTYSDYSGQGTSGSGSACSATKDGITIASSKGYKPSDNHVREYSGGTITFSGATITKIELTSTASGTSSNGPSKIDKNNGESGSYSYSGSVGTWTNNTGDNNVVLKCSAQFRWTQIVVTYTASKTLSSISVKTAPTKTTYTEGDNFNPTGLIITKEYSDDSTEDWAYASHASDFTFSPSTSAALTTSNTSVTITVGGKSTTQSITVNAKVAAVVKLSEAGIVTTVSGTRYTGDSYTLPSTCSQTCGTKTFVGWSTVEIQTPGAKPTSNYYEPGDEVTLVADNTFYAVFADASSGGGTSNEFEMLSTSSSVTAGDYVIINFDGTYAMSSDFNSGTSGEFKGVSVSPSNNKVTVTNTKLIWTFEEGTTSGQFSLKNNSTNTYANITGTSSTNAALSNDRVYFTFGTSGTDNIWKVKSVSYSARGFSYYSNNTSFRTYAHSSNNTGYLYKRSSGGTTYTNYATSCGPSTYTVNFECNGATSGCPSQMTEQTNLPNPLPTIQQKTGYTFGGWYTNEGLTNAATAGAALTENTTLYAKWNIINRTVTYNGDGQLNYTAKPTTATIEDAGIEVTYSVNTGYEITGVSVTMGGTALVENTDFMWDQDDVTIMPDDGNGITGNIVVTFTVQATSPETKTIYLEPNVWDITSAKFFVHAWGGGDADVEMATTVNCESKILQADVPLETTNVIFTRQNKSTSSLTWDWNNGLWNKSKEVSLGTNNYVKITTYEGGEWDYEHQLSGTEAKSYSGPNWSVRGTFNGENYGTAHTMVKGDGCDGTVSLTLAANTTYYFKVVNETLGYWYGCTPNPTPTASFSNYDFVQGENNNCPFTTTVAGIYTFAVDYSNPDAPKVSVTYPIKYTVTYDGNGNTSGSAPAAVDYAKGAMVTVAGNTGSLAKTGYDFGGWNTKADGTGTNYTAGSGTFTISANTTLYAKWTIKSYTVTKGTITGGSATVPSSVNHGADVTLAGLTPDANHKLPYTITVTGNYGSIEGATIKNVTSAITVNVSFAEKAQYTVTFKNNGTQTSTQQVVEGGTVSSLPTLTASQAPISGYTFVGWVNHSNVWSGFEAEMTQALITGNEVINADVTYDAVWAKATNVYKILDNPADFTSGNYVIDGYDDSDDSEEAMNNTLNSSNKIDGAAFPAADHGVITTTDNSIIWRITVNNNTCALYSVTQNKYLSFTSGVATFSFSTDPVWITVSSDVVDDILEWYLTYNSRYLEYDIGVFDTWSSKDYSTIYLYKQKVNNYFVTPPAQVTVTWHIGNGTQTATTYDGTAFTELTAPEVDDDAIGDCVNKFMGWATAEINIDEATAENVAWADETTISNSNKDFYAVFAQAEESTDYTQITSEDDLEAGGRYLIVGNSSSTYKALPVGKAETLTTVSPSSSTISNPADELVWTLEGSADAWKIKSVSNSKYLQISGGSLTFETSTSLTFSVSVSSSKFTFTSSASSGNKILSYYANGNKFNAFTIANTVYVYKSSTTYSNYATTCPTTATIKTYDGSTLLQTLTDKTLNEAVTPTAPSAKTGYDFVGWNENQEATTGSMTFTPTIAKEYTLYAIWQAHKHTLTYANTEDATIGNGTAAGQVAYGTALTTPTNVTKPGYDFAGWSANLPATMPDNDVTITASWTPHTYTATVQQEGGTGITSMTVTYLDDKLVITGTSTKNEFKLTGYLIGSTQIADKDGNLLPNVDGYTNADGQWIGTSNPTIKVEWTAIVWTDYLTDCGTLYDITLVGGGTKTGGTFSASAVSAIGGSTVTLTANPNSCYNFTSSSWNVYKTGESSTEVTVTDNTFTMPEYDVTVDATFTQIDYVISYELQGGDAPQGSEETYGPRNVGCGNTWTAPVDPVKAGYTFQGWLGEESATRYKQGDGFVPTQAQTMVAQWTANPYVWTLYNNQSGEWTDADIDDVTSGSVVFNFTEKEQQFRFKIRKTNDDVNYTYYGASDGDNEYTYAKSLDDEHKYWTLNGNAGGYDVKVTTAAKGTYTIHISMDGDNPRIYIEYPTPYTIHFDGKGADYGSMADIVNIASGENVELPDNDFTKTNNAFVGWDTNSAGTNVVYGNQATINNVSADITLYAVWVSARYTITLDANGGTVSPDKVQQAVVGGTVALPTPTKDGYAFDGWYTEREGGNKITEAYPIPLADATYYAHWTSLETTWYLKGDFDWSTGVQFEKLPGETGSIAYATVELSSDTQFKLHNSSTDKWYSYNHESKKIKQDDCTNWTLYENNNNSEITISGDGRYTFKLDYSGANPVISVAYPNWYISVYNKSAGSESGHFTYLNPTEWIYANFTVPTPTEDNNLWVSDREAWSDKHSAEWPYRWIMLKQYVSEKIGHSVDGAVGTLYINPFSTGSQDNYGLRFDPAGYGMKYGTGLTAESMTAGHFAFTQKTNDPAVWNTQAIENIEELQGKKFYVGLATATAGDYKFSYDYSSDCNGLSAIANINDIKVWTEANPDRWGDATVGSLSNTRGHFQIWADNASQKNFYIHWIPDNKMTFDLGDAEGHIAAIDPMYRGRDLSGSEATITLPEPADWISHTFDGWVINGVQHDAGDEILLNEDMTAVAQWTTNYYTITYTGISAYSTTCDGSTLVLCGTAQTVCIPIEATGYEFSGWTSDVEIGGETEFEGGEDFTMPCEDVTFTGSYTPITYNITYEGLEGASNPNPTNYTIETPTITLQDPGARTGYEFLGWFDAETDGNQVTGIVLGSTGDVTVWAHWNALQINVTLKANYTDGTDGSVNFTYGTSTKSAYTAVSNKFGYTLLGYYTSAESGIKILNANGDIDGPNKSGWIDAEGNWIRTAADSKLYAHWSAISGIDYYVYHYQMNVDGTYPETPTDQTSGKGKTDEVKTNLEPNVYEGFVTPAHKDLTIVYGGENILKYYYERNKYELTWAGLEDATVTGEYTQGQVYHGATITYPSVSKDGYCFMGWDPKPTTMPMAATTITARWGAYENYRTYCGNAVTFVANGGMGEDYVVTVDADKLTHIPTVETAGFTREGYGFAGWMVDGDESKTVYAPDATINPITDGMIVNAVWISIPTINAAVPVITSTNNVGIASAQRTLTVANPDGLEATIHIAYKKNGEAVLPTNSEFRFCNTGGNISENNITSSETAIATDFTIQYKPNAYNKIDSDYTLYITVTRKGSEAIVSSAEFNLKGRSLPEKFVIAVKNNSEQWLALPANMTGACTPAGMPITVTGEGLGMTADASVAAAYSLTGHNFEDFARDSVFFKSAYNNGELWASKSGYDINDNTAAVSKLNRNNYEWGLTPTDETLISYNMANQNNGSYLRYYNDSKFGMYASGVNAIYFIAVTPREETTAVVDEWYKNKILFHLPFAMKSVSMTINGVAVADITIVERKIKTTGYVLYELGGNIDLVAHSGQVMELTIGDGTTEYVANISIPQIIVGEVVGSTLPAKADVVVRDGGHLTIDITNEGVAPKSFNNVTIYPNSKISVPEGKYFNVKSLTFFGGIDEWYDTEESEYVETNIYAPELSLKGTMKADTLIYRMRVNAEHMMPVSFPYNVTINKIVREDKLDSPSWGKVGTDIRLETYNGELRAAGNRRYSDESTWTEIKEGTLTAGIGYTVAAQNRFKNYLYTVLDFPMANPYKDAAAEEAVKNAAVQAHDAVNWYDKGWNLMGNPYMAGITGAGAIKVNETDYDFVYIPTADGGDYYQGPIATAKILPFKDFFVQVNEGGTMYFDLTKRVDAPARMLADIERTAQFSIGLAGADKTDITYFKVADNFTESYDIPGDNAKMFGSAVNTKVYSLLNGEDQLAQMALNADMTAQPIQLGYIAPENGEYIFALDNTYTDYQNVEHIYLLENGEIKVDLLNAQYTFTTEAKTEDERFAILIVMKGAKMPTDLMDGLFDNDVASPKKVIYNDHFYILNTNRRVYDGTGKYINKMQKNK